MTDVLQALRDNSLKAEERLRVAAAIARSANSSLPEEKTTFLAKWACEEICNANSRKNRQDNTFKYARMVSGVFVFPRVVLTLENTLDSLE